MHQRGQITLFIIIGIIFLMIFGIVFFFQTVPEGQTAFVQQVPSEFEPIRQFTEECLKRITIDGVRLMGQQGGYLFPRQLLQNEFIPTEAEGVVFSPGSSIFVPYWYHNQARNSDLTVQIVTSIPSREDMARELERYVGIQLPICLDNYNLFREQGFTPELGADITIDVAFVPGKLRIIAHAPVVFTKAETRVTLSDFATELDVDIGRVYELAQNIVQHQSSFTFLENHFLSMLPLFSKLDEDALPPLTGSSFVVGNTLFWNAFEVKQNLKTLLTTTIPMLRYQGSANFYSADFTQDRFGAVKQRVYNNMILPLDGADGIEVRFIYLDWWEPFVVMNDNSGIIEPQGYVVAFAGLVFGMQRFKTVYDISFPVVVQLTIPEGLDGEEFTLQFALEANLRDNRPAKTGTVVTEPFFSPGSLVCATHQRNSGNITVNVVDAYTSLPVTDAQISYTFGDETCPIGATNEQGVLIAHFPVGIGGLVTAHHEEYAGADTRLNTVLDREADIELRLWKFHELDATIEKKKLVKCTNTRCFFDVEDFESPLNQRFSKQTSLPFGEGWHFLNIPETLSNAETAILTLNYLNDSLHPLHSSVVVIGQQRVPVRLVPGTYEIKGQLIDAKTLIIPEEQRNVEFKTVTIPELRSDSFMTGGITMTFTLEPGDLYTADSITFYTVAAGLHEALEKTVEDLAIIGEVETYSATHKNELKPVLL